MEELDFLDLKGINHSLKKYRDSSILIDPPQHLEKFNDNEGN